MESVMVNQILVYVALVITCVIVGSISHFIEKKKDAKLIKKAQQQRAYEKSYEEYLKITHGDPAWIGE